jgi:hypothetical protein
MTKLSNAALNRTESVLSYLEAMNQTLDTQLRVLGSFPEHKAFSDAILEAQTKLGLAIVKGKGDLK